MAKLFIKQAKQYAETRPDYPKQLFDFIASKTHTHDLAWDVGTGSGQAAQSLAGIYKNVIATDTSLKQLEFAPKLPNIRYEQTPPVLSMAELEQLAPQGSLDLVTIAQALHWVDTRSFYEQVKWVLKKPHGIIAAWCYTNARVNDSVDSVFDRFYTVDSYPYWEPARRLVEKEYRSIDFPFEAVDGADDTGPFEFVTEKMMDLEDWFAYIRSWSAYQTAKEKGVELLNSHVVGEFEVAWNQSGDGHKAVKFPMFLRIGKVGKF
ncbi:hypothetical protein FNV43_RR16420 [Rhamnella rubrinervis]|uniref:Methyltransferase type 11 domain-containing protein n=1 Tax=Rhamnella rubrinervis TaxID=2594499 RepID=A0A8K0MBY4_9ROSA|nr:hypothetical protein FNV43_RR16420 [Rhamnella rubrinervis]